MTGPQNTPLNNDPQTGVPLGESVAGQCIIRKSIEGDMLAEGYKAAGSNPETAEKYGEEYFQNTKNDCDQEEKAAAGKEPKEDPLDACLKNIDLAAAKLRTTDVTLSDEEKEAGIRSVTGEQKALCHSQYSNGDGSFESPLTNFAAQKGQGAIFPK